MSTRADPAHAAPSAALRSAGVRPSKARGQNFLVQRAVAQRIAGLARIVRGDAVVEIGPGLGMLTGELIAANPRRLTLVELDGRLAAGLAERFADAPAVTVINRDFLKVSPDDLGEPPLKVVGNLPFSSAAAILHRLCGCHQIIERMVLMFQREVAERIRARPGSANYGALSAFTALYWRLSDHLRVAAGSFHPRPKVEAEVLVMEPHREPAFVAGEEAAILATIRAVFSAPRKTVRNSLAGGSGLTLSQVEAALGRAAIDPAARPATLGTAELIALAKCLRAATD